MGKIDDWWEKVLRFALVIAIGAVLSVVVLLMGWIAFRIAGADVSFF